MNLDPTPLPHACPSLPLRLFPAALALLFCTMTASAESAPAASHGLVLVANKAEHTLGLIDPVASQQLAVIPEDAVTGHEVIASPDGRRAFVPIYGNSGVGHPGTDGQLIRVIDLAERKIAATIDLGHGLRPHCPIFNPHDGLLYVTTELTNAITVIDPKTLQVVGHVPTGQPESHMLAITRDGRRGYTANVGPGTVSVLDLEARRVLTVIPIAPHTQRISLSPDDRFAFTADVTQPRLAVIDTATNGIRTWVTLPGTGYGTAATPDGRYLLICVIKGNKVAVLDLKTFTLTHTIDVPATPQEVIVQPDGAFAYISCDRSAQVAVLDLKAWKVSKLIKAGAGADGLAWASTPSPGGPSSARP